MRNLYTGQEATVRTGHGTTDWFQLGKGMCQGAPPSNATGFCCVERSACSPQPLEAPDTGGHRVISGRYCGNYPTPTSLFYRLKVQSPRVGTASEPSGSCRGHLPSAPGCCPPLGRAPPGAEVPRPGSRDSGLLCGSHGEIQAGFTHRPCGRGCCCPSLSPCQHREPLVKVGSGPGARQGRGEPGRRRAG